MLSDKELIQDLEREVKLLRKQLNEVRRNLESTDRVVDREIEKKCDARAEIRRLKAELDKERSQRLEVNTIEELAAVAHEAWSGWMEYLFEECHNRLSEPNTAEPAAVIPGWAVHRWKRQAQMSYADLPEDEKESDRVEARKYLAVMQEASEPGVGGGEKD